MPYSRFISIGFKLTPGFILLSLALFLLPLSLNSSQAVALIPSPAEENPRTHLLAVADIINLWTVNVETKKIQSIIKLEEGKEIINTVSWSPDGQQLAVSLSSADHKSERCRTVIFTPDGQTIRRMEGVSYARWSPKGTYLIYYTGPFGSTMRKAHVVKTSDLSQVLDFPEASYIGFSPDETRIIAGRLVDNEIYFKLLADIFDSGGRKLWSSPPGKPVSSLHFSPDSRWFFCDETLYNLETGVKRGLPGYPSDFSPDSRLLALYLRDRQSVCLYDPEKDEVAWVGDFEPTPTDLYPGDMLYNRSRFTADGRFLYTPKPFESKIISVDLNDYKTSETALNLPGVSQKELIEIIPGHLSPDWKYAVLFRPPALWLIDIEKQLMEKIAELPVRWVRIFGWHSR